ncbi:LysR family transcriptional regulator [Pseudomonas sp. 18175]|uniref:LysR family transcriptional regulator n=1 Tax=Pseudomonas sp. 18175 TaxID=3390056 RepID=UPI003D1F4306
MSGHRLPSLGGLRAFESAARLGRMSLAARELCVTPGAVSRSIRHLEQELGVTLFCGPKRALCLTDRGRELATVLTDAFGRVESTISPYFHEVAGALQLSCPGTLAAHWLIPRLPRFQRHAPDIPVQLTTSNRPVDFQREPYDVAIRLAEHPLPDTTRISQLFPEFVGLVVSPNLFKQDAEPSLSALSQLPVLCSRTRPQLWALWAKQQGMAEDRTLSELDHFYYVIKAVKAGLGIGVVPWQLVMEDLEQGELLAPFGFIRSGHAYVVARRQIRSARVERLCAWLVNEAKATPLPEEPCLPVHSGQHQ